MPEVLSRLAEFAGVGLPPWELDARAFVAALPDDPPAMFTALLALRRELVRRGGEEGAQKLLHWLATPATKKPRHRPRGSTPNKADNARLLAALDERIAKAKGATLRQIIAALAKDELREKSFSTTRDRADAEKRLRERINYQNRQRAKDMAEERMALAAALQKDGLIFGLGPAALATREAASRRDALVAALIGRHEPAE